MDENIKKVAMGRLISQHGWTPDRLLDTVVMKDYPTAVGLKMAVARIIDDSANHQYWLNGEYQSEGNNALATCFACIPSKASETEVEALVDAFAGYANKLVGETYAARLLATA